MRTDTNEPPVAHIVVTVLKKMLRGGAGSSSTSTHCPDRLRLSCRTHFSLQVRTLSKNHRKGVLILEKPIRTDFEARQSPAITQIVGYPFFEDFQLSEAFQTIAISRTVCGDGLASTKAIVVVDCCRSVASGSSRLKSSERNFLNHRYTALSLTLFGPHMWLIYRAVSTSDWASLKLKRNRSDSPTRHTSTSLRRCPVIKHRLNTSCSLR